LFDNATSEDVHLEQVEIDTDDGIVTIHYGQGQSVSGKVQNQLRTTLLARILVTLEEQNELLRNADVPSEPRN
jgi:hypothetical protein